MPAHQPLADGRELAALFLVEAAKPEQRAAEEQRMFANHPLYGRLQLRRQRIPGGAHVGELRVAALGWNRARVQHRVLGRRGLEAAVRMPETVAEVEHAAAVGGGEDLAVLVEVRDVVHERMREAMPVD